MSAWDENIGQTDEYRPWFGSRDRAEALLAEKRILSELELRNRLQTALMQAKPPEMVEALLAEKRMLDRMRDEAWRVQGPEQRTDWSYRLGQWLIKLGEHVRDS